MPKSRVQDLVRASIHQEGEPHNQPRNRHPNPDGATVTSQHNTRNVTSIYPQLEDMDEEFQYQNEEEDGLVESENLSGFDVSYPDLDDISRSVSEEDLRYSVPHREYKVKGIPKTPKKSTKRSSTKEKSWSSLFSRLLETPTLLRILFVLVNFLFLTFALYKYIQPSSPEGYIRTRTRIDLTEIMNKLKLDFQQQTKISFRVICKAIEKVTESENPMAPAVILLVASKGAENDCYRLAYNLAHNISSPPVLIEGEEYQFSDVNVVRKDISHILQASLKPDSLRSVLMPRLDLIPGKAALMFQSYFDHENANFKHVVYVITISPGKEIDSTPKTWDALANDHLRSVWSDTGKDQIYSLLSRLTVSVVAVVPEKL